LRGRSWQLSHPQVLSRSFFSGRDLAAERKSAYWPDAQTWEKRRSFVTLPIGEVHWQQGMTKPDYRKVPAYIGSAGPTITLRMYGGTVAPNVRTLLSTPINVAWGPPANKPAALGTAHRRRPPRSLGR
jgi:hypothetical protein